MFGIVFMLVIGAIAIVAVTWWRVASVLNSPPLPDRETVDEAGNRIPRPENDPALIGLSLLLATSPVVGVLIGLPLGLGLPSIPLVSRLMPSDVPSAELGVLIDPAVMALGMAALVTAAAVALCAWLCTRLAQRITAERGGLTGGDIKALRWGWASAMWVGGVLLLVPVVVTGGF